MKMESVKLSLLEWLAQVEDLSVLTKLKKFRDEIEVSQYEQKLKHPMTEKELITRAKRSEEDIRKGRYKSLDKVIRESKNW